MLLTTKETFDGTRHPCERVRLLSNKYKAEAGVSPNSSFVLQHLDLQRRGGQMPLTHRTAPVTLHLPPAW